MTEMLRAWHLRRTIRLTGSRGTSFQPFSNRRRSEWSWLTPRPAASRSTTPKPSGSGDARGYPLHSLQVLVQGIIRRHLTISPDALQQSLPIIERQVKRLTRLVAILLDVSRIQLGRVTLELEEVDLSAVVQDIVAQFTEEATRADSPISVRGAAHVRGRWDRARLEQVVANLLSNAIKFGAGEPIDVLVEADHDRARLVVQDHGIGVAPERLPHIFDRFERGVSARSYGGLGLGLFLARSIVNAHGGTLNAESTVGSGSCFTVELPCAGPVGPSEGAL
jgi:signal transduction histidine kinase